MLRATEQAFSCSPHAHEDFDDIQGIPPSVPPPFPRGHGRTASRSARRRRSTRRDPGSSSQLASRSRTPGAAQGWHHLSLDRQIGDFAKGDVLIEGARIAAVGADLSAASRSAHRRRRGRTIVMPVFIDTHHHQYETIRGESRGRLLVFRWRGHRKYYGDYPGVFTPAYMPEDAYVAELVASLNQISAGVTTTVDTFTGVTSPEHTDACIAGP